MATITTTDNLPSDLGEAPLNTTTSVQGVSKFEVIVPFSCEHEQKIVVNEQLMSIDCCKDVWAQFGQIRILKIAIRFVGRDDSTVSAAVTQYGAQVSADAILGFNGSISVAMTKYTAGVQHEFVLNIPENVSKQVKPPGADMPQAQLFMEIQGLCRGALCIEFVPSGPCLFRKTALRGSSG